MNFIDSSQFIIKALFKKTQEFSTAKQEKIYHMYSRFLVIKEVNLLLNKVLNGSHQLPLLAIVLRSVILYIAVIFATRIMGKRQVGILSGHNYLVAAGIVSLVAVRMVNPNTSLIRGLVTVFIYALFNRFWSFIDLKAPALIDRKPVTLMDNGIIYLENLKKVQLTVADFLMGLRQKKVWNLSAIYNVVLEPTGEFSVLKKSEHSPITLKDMNIKKESSVTVMPNVVLKQHFQDAKLLKELDPSYIGVIKNPDGTLTYIKG